MKVGGAFGRVHDPHRHIHKEQVPKATFVDPFFGQTRSGGKPVVEIYALTHAHFFGFGNHFFGVGNVVGNRLFT